MAERVERIDDYGRIEFDIDDEYRRALIRQAARARGLQVVEGATRNQFVVVVRSWQDCYQFGLETGYLTFGSSER